MLDAINIGKCASDKNSSHVCRQIERNTLRLPAQERRSKQIAGYPLKSGDYRVRQKSHKCKSQDYKEPCQRQIQSSSSGDLLRTLDRLP